MKKMSKVFVSLLILIIISVLFSALPGCEEKKDEVQAPVNAETKATVTTEEQKAAEVKAAELKEQEKKATADAALKAAEQKTAEQKATVAQTQSEKKTTEQNPSQKQNKLSPSSETIEQVLIENGFWETTATDWVGTGVADFNLVDINGKRHKLSDYRDKNVIVFEWATWCPGCKAQIPILIDLREKVGEDQLVILAVAIKTDKDNLENVKDAVQKEKLNFPVFYENQNSLGLPFYVNVFVPCHFFIRPDGTLKAAIAEIITVRDLIRILEAK